MRAGTRFALRLLTAASSVVAIDAAAQGTLRDSIAAPSSADRLLSISSVVSGRDPAAWHPDGTRLAFLGSFGGPVGVWEVSATGGAPTQIVADASLSGAGSAASQRPLWSPTGEHLAYVSSRGGAPEIWLWSARGGATVPLTSLGARVNSMNWSPDGRRIAFAGDRYGSPDIYIVDVPSGEVTRLTSEPEYEVYPTWTPDGRTILYDKLDDRWVQHDVLAIPADGSADPRLVVREPKFFDYRGGSAFGEALVSRDGRSVLFRSQRSGWSAYWLAPIGGGTPRQLAAEQADQSDARWSPDGSQVLFLSITNGTQSVKVAPAAGGAARTIFAPEVGMASRAEWSPDGARISFALGTPTRAPDLYVVAASGGTPKQVTFSDRDGTLANALVTPEKIRWTNEGLTINAYLYKPKSLPASGRAPVLMLVHGGPTSQFSDSYQLQAQFFASRGYVVIAPNVRGSSGYGKRFEDLNNRDWGHGDLRDVVTGVKWAKSQPYVDPNKIGITGVSYGGMLTMYAISFAPGVFQAAVSQSGYGDVRDFHNIVPELQHSQLLHYELGKWPSTPAVDSIYRRSSSILKAKDATAPALIIHGYGLHVLDADYAAWKFARELAKHSKLVEYKSYPNETYYVYGRENTKQMLQDIVAFLDRYLKDDSIEAVATASTGPESR